MLCQYNEYQQGQPTSQSIEFQGAVFKNIYPNILSSLLDFHRALKKEGRDQGLLWNSVLYTVRNCHSYWFNKMVTGQ